VKPITFSIVGSIRVNSDRDLFLEGRRNFESVDSVDGTTKTHKRRRYTFVTRYSSGAAKRTAKAPMSSNVMSTLLDFFLCMTIRRKTAKSAAWFR